ncbi:MAG: hypothetical protein CBB87_00230 [Micavibrio sp. TMED27]|nr:hypothetical protein [Micavibrio sp.]OUT93021.1 MAG: hypothetical protein CBB87_00230 [Micavibrio sp. TMED27]|tara:strand:- start:18905 stop:19867 length:963 start_codon:yes stop_codon:yes gene_type:complete
MKKLRATLSQIKHYPNYPGLVIPDTLPWLHFYEKVSSKLNQGEYKHRKDLLNKIPKTTPEYEIEDQLGYLIADMSKNELVMNAIANAKQQANQIDWEEKEKTSKKAFLLNHKLDLTSPENEAILKLVLSPEILRPISDYLGSFPILSSAALWYSPNKDARAKGSQLYHLDGEDIKQIKCFLPVDEITSETGPLTILPADVSDNVYNTLHQKNEIQRRNTKLEDDIVYQYAQEDQAKQVVGKPGTVAFIDTCRCYHYGSRTAQKPRLLLHLHFYSAFSKMMPLWGREERAVQAPVANDFTGALFNKSHLAFPNARMAKNNK